MTNVSDNWGFFWQFFSSEEKNLLKGVGSLGSHVVFQAICRYQMYSDVLH